MKSTNNQGASPVSTKTIKKQAAHRCDPEDFQYSVCGGYIVCFEPPLTQTSTERPRGVEMLQREHFGPWVDNYEGMAL